MKANNAVLSKEMKNLIHLTNAHLNDSSPTRDDNSSKFESSQTKKGAERNDNRLFSQSSSNQYDYNAYIASEEQSLP